MKAGTSQRERALEARGFYDDLGTDYDLMVSWETRLEREKTFLRRMREETDAESVLDAACGTGMHAVAFARDGMRSAGADLSPQMIEQARRNAKAAGVAVDLRVAAFGELSRTFSTAFDMVTCLGNSLPHLLDDASLRAALADFSGVLRPGGTCVIQIRNYDRLLRERQRFMPPAARTEGAEETVFLRITDFRDGAQGDSAQGDDARSENVREESARHERAPEIVDFTIITLKKRSGAWSQSVRTTALRALRRRALEDTLRSAGFSNVRAWGGFDSSPFDEASSPDLLVAASTPIPHGGSHRR